MKIAVTYENGNVFQHFGHTEQFKLYQAEGKQITGSQVVDTNGQGHGALAGFLQAQGVQVLICGGIGGGTRSAGAGGHRGVCRRGRRHRCGGEAAAAGHSAPEWRRDLQSPP